MENNDRTTIELALKLINENNKIVLSSISKDYKSKNNFYKLSEVDLSPDLKEDLDDGPSVDDIKAVIEGRMDPAAIKPKTSPKTDSKEKEKDKRKNPGLFGSVEMWLSNIQAGSIYKYLQKTDPDKVKGLSVEDIKNMSLEKRADLLGVEYRPNNSRSRSYKTYNPNIGHK